MDLFVRLHGMLFTKIDLDNFSTVMARFMERLEEDARLDGVSRKATVTQVDWIVMASVNIAAVLQYGAAMGVLRKALSLEGQERRRAQAVNGDDDGDDGEAADNVESGPVEEAILPTYDISAEVNPTFLNALHLTFTMLNFAFQHPTRQQGLHAVLNPYITLMLTFLSTMCRQPHVAGILVDHMPWKGLVDFLTRTGLEIREETRLMAGPPLPEDWAVRGMEWVGRRVYERGFWKAKTPGRGSGAMAQPTPRSGERFQSEMDVLLANFETSLDISEGIIDEADGTDLTDGPVAVNQRRWKRVIWAAGVLLKHIDGFDLVDGGLTVQGALRTRLDENERAKKAEEERDQRREIIRREKERAEELVELEALLEAGDDEADLRELKVGPLPKVCIVLTVDPSRSASSWRGARTCRTPKSPQGFQIRPARSARLHDACVRHECSPFLARPLPHRRGKRSMERHRPPPRRHRAGRSVQESTPARPVRDPSDIVPRVPDPHALALPQDPDFAGQLPFRPAYPYGARRFLGPACREPKHGRPHS